MFPPKETPKSKPRFLLRPIRITEVIIRFSLIIQAHPINGFLSPRSLVAARSQPPVFPGLLYAK